MSNREIEETYSRIRIHLATFWPEHVAEEFVWNVEPIKEVLPRFRVIRLAPSGNAKYWVYVTCGCWEVRTGETVRSEFFLLSPIEDVTHVQTLTMVAKYHADSSHRLSPGKSINLGYPWLDESLCDHLLV